MQAWRRGTANPNLEMTDDCNPLPMVQSEPAAVPSSAPPLPRVRRCIAIERKRANSYYRTSTAYGAKPLRELSSARPRSKREALRRGLVVGALAFPSPSPRYHRGASTARLHSEAALAKQAADALEEAEIARSPYLCAACTSSCTATLLVCCLRLLLRRANYRKSPFRSPQSPSCLSTHTTAKFVAYQKPCRNHQALLQSDPAAAASKWRAHRALRSSEPVQPLFTPVSTTRQRSLAASSAVAREAAEERERAARAELLVWLQQMCDGGPLEEANQLQQFEREAISGVRHSCNW